MMQPMARRRRNAFTLVELLVVIAIIALLVSIIVPSFTQARRLALRAKCASNLREIGRSCVAYAGDGRYHRGNDISSALPSNGPTTGNWGDFTDGNPGSLWLLVKYNYLKGSVLLCPAAKTSLQLRAPGSNDTAFTSKTYSYSYLSQVTTADGHNATSTEDADASLVIAADGNPRCTPGSTTIGTNNGKNSKNHNGDGQNVVRIDQSVGWTTSPTDNVKDDDIYAAGSGGSDGQGQRGNINDSFLLP